MKLLLATFTAAFATSFVVTPCVRRLARRWGIVDHPDEHRKLHDEATPLGGGLAVLLTFVLVVAAVLTFSDSQRAEAADNASFLAGLITSAIILCTVGLFDDRFGLRGRQKLLGQVGATAVLVASGLVIRKVEIFGLDLDFGIFAAPFTMFWLLGAINALNLLDGSDGLATIVGIVMSLAAGCMALLTGHPTEAFLALAIAGALCGFLVYNLPPASIFLGDAGSMVIGLVVGALAIRSAFKGPVTVMLAATTAIWAIPIFDVGMAIIRRRLTGRSIYITDRAHLHHSLLQRGFSTRMVVALVGGLCCVAAGFATLSVYWENELVAWGGFVVVCGVLVGFRLFGHRECSLLVERVRGLIRSLVPSMRVRSAAEQTNHSLSHFRDDRTEWDELWIGLVGFAERFGLTSIQLNVSQPSRGKEFHATWHRQDPAQSPAWHSKIPLRANNAPVGQLSISGDSANGCVFSWMSDLILGLKPLEANVEDLLTGAWDGAGFTFCQDLAEVEDCEPALSVSTDRTNDPRVAPR